MAVRKRGFLAQEAKHCAQKQRKESQRFTPLLSACYLPLSILGPDGSGFSKSGKDRAVGPCIAAASFGQIKQRAAHGLECGRLAGEVLGMTKGDGLDLAAHPRSIIPQAQEGRYFVHREPKVAGIGDGNAGARPSAGDSPDNRSRAGRRAASGR